MKYLVLGCNGMAGHMISLYLKERGYEVLGFARKNNGFIKTIIGDATDFNKLKEIVQTGSFDFIINCVGILNKKAEDNVADAIKINSYLPHFLEEITNGSKTKIIQISTDCVFSGKDGGYTEDSVCDGLSIYDKTKSLGELRNNKDITLRMSIIGPDINISGIGLFNWFMNQSGTIKGYTDAIWTGVTTLELAKIIEQASKQNISGLYNMVNNENISKYNLLKLFKKYFYKDIIIEKDDSVKVDKSLKRTNFSFNYTVPSYEDMIKEMAEWIGSHKNIYPDYIGGTNE